MALVASLLIAPALAQNPAGTDARALQERRDQLARDLEGLSDPDPLMRIAVMESLLKRGDASAAYLAARSGFASDDPAMRNLAMRAWIATVKRLNLTVVLPGDLQKQVDAALFDPKQASELFKPDSWLSTWARRSFTLALGFTGIDVDKASGKIWSMPAFSEQNAVDFSLSGSEVYATFPVDFTPGQLTCHLRLAPTPGLTIDGTVACDFNRPSPPLRVTAPMF